LSCLRDVAALILENHWGGTPQVYLQDSETMVKNVFVTVLVCLALLAQSCRPTEQPPSLHLIYVIDLTCSIEIDAQTKAFDQIESVLEILQRGDALTIIPVTGDPMTQVQGHIIRQRWSIDREPYDDDLQKSTQTAKESIIKLRSYAKEIRESKAPDKRNKPTPNPCIRTDILSAVEVAAEEVSDIKARKIIVILSDFIQDDNTYDFNNSKELLNEESAKTFARTISQVRSESFQGIIVYMGLLNSIDMKSLDSTRRSAILAFWKEYFCERGSLSIIYKTDGTGQLTIFVNSLRNQKSDANQNKSNARQTSVPCNSVVLE
jgi:hypothetical protein